MISKKAFLAINFSLTILKFSLGSCFLSTHFELYAKDNDVTESFSSQYQLASAGYRHKISLTECASYCSSLKYCFTIGLNIKENYCRVYNALPLLDSFLSPSNGSNVYTIAGKKRFFNMSCTQTEECDEANGLACINNLCKCTSQTYFWSLYLSKCMPCQNEWYANFEIGLCFMYYPSLLNWNSANSFCKGQNASLVNIKSDAAFNFIRDASRNFTSGNYSIWVGSNTTVINQFKWSDSTKVSPAYYAHGEPSNRLNKFQLIEGCLEMRRYNNYFFNDEPCSTRNAFFCSL